MKWKRRRRRRESDEEEETKLEVWRRSRRRRERGEKARGEGGGFEEAALRTRTTERPVRRQSAARGRRRETHAEGKTEKEAAGGREARGRRESQRRERDQPSQLQRERTASLANHSRFSSRVTILFEIEQREEGRNPRVIVQVPPSHRGRLRNLRGVSIFRGSLLGYHERVGSNRTRDERRDSLERFIDLDVPADSSSDILKSRAPTQRCAGHALRNRDDARMANDTANAHRCKPTYVLCRMTRQADDLG